MKNLEIIYSTKLNQFDNGNIHKTIKLILFIFITLINIFLIYYLYRIILSIRFNINHDISFLGLLCILVIMVIMLLYLNITTFKKRITLFITNQGLLIKNGFRKKLYKWDVFEGFYRNNQFVCLKVKQSNSVPVEIYVAFGLTMPLPFAKQTKLYYNLHGKDGEFLIALSHFLPKL